MLVLNALSLRFMLLRVCCAAKACACITKFSKDLCEDLFSLLRVMCMFLLHCSSPYRVVRAFRRTLPRLLWTLAVLPQFARYT